jgi:hypothetical protein
MNARSSEAAAVPPATGDRNLVTENQELSVALHVTATTDGTAGTEPAPGGAIGTAGTAPAAGEPLDD